MLNNSIKHSEELLNDKTRNIPEFKGRNSINSATINIFYDRIMECAKGIYRGDCCRNWQKVYQ